MKQYRKYLSLSIAMTFLACGGGGGETTTSTQNEPTQSLKGLELYNFNLSLKKGKRQYNSKKIDPITGEITPYYFDFTTKSFTQESTPKTVFIDGKRYSNEDIAYQFNSTGELQYLIDENPFATLSYQERSVVKESEFEPYRSKFTIKGNSYKTKLTYSKSVITVNKLASNKVFESLTEFREAYTTKPFMGSLSQGLLFGENGELRELKKNKIDKNGRYEIKTIGDKEAIFIYPNNPKAYYSANTCFILDYSRVWKAKCHEKNSQQSIFFYDKSIYNSAKSYLEKSFVELNISI